MQIEISILRKNLKEYFEITYPTKSKGIISGMVSDAFYAYNNGLAREKFLIQTWDEFGIDALYLAILDKLEAEDQNNFQARAKNYRNALVLLSDYLHNKYKDYAELPLLINTNIKEVADKSLLQYCQKMSISYSYKPILIKSLVHFGVLEIKYDDVLSYFLGYYSQRRKNGLIPEKDDSIFSYASIDSEMALKLIKKMPLRILEEQGFLTLKKELIVLSENTYNEIHENGEQIVNCCDGLLEKYYTQIESKAVSLDDKANHQEGSQEKRIGVLVKDSMHELEKQGFVFDDISYNNCLSKEWSQKTLHLFLPFFKEVQLNCNVKEASKDERGYNRYWNRVFTFGDKHVLICSQWYAEDSEKFLAWYNSLIMTNVKQQIIENAVDQNEPNKEESPFSYLIFKGKKRYYYEDLTKRDYNLENTAPYQLIIMGHTIFEHSWGELLCKMVIELLKVFPTVETRLLEFKCPWSSQTIFSSEEKTNYRKVKENLYINCNHTALHSCWLLQDILDYFNVDKNSVQLLIHRPSGAETPEVKEYVKKKFIEGFKNYLITTRGKDIEKTDKIVTVIDKYLNPMLLSISKSYVDWFLFDDIATMYNYIKKTQEMITTNIKFDSKARAVLFKYLSYLTDYYKA